MTEHPFRRFSQLLLPLVLTAAVVALGALSILRKVESFQPLGFEARSATGAWVVEPGAAAETGLLPGDQIVLVDGAQLASPAEVRERLIAAPSVELLVLRDGVPSPVQYQRQALQLDWPYLVQVGLGLAYLLIGLFTLVRAPKNPGRVFFLWCLTSVALYLLTEPAVFDAVGKAIALVDGLALLLLAPLTLHLFLMFPTAVFEAEKLRRWLPFAYLPAALLLTAQFDQAFLDGRLLSGPPTVEAVRLLGRLEIYHLVVFVLVSVLVLAYRLAGSYEPAERRQLRWITLGVAGGYLPYILFNVVPTALELPRFQLLDLVAVLPLALVPLTFAYAILRYKLWDLDNVVRDTIAHALTLLIGVLGFALINLGLRRGIPQDLVTARHLVSFIAGLSIAGLLVPTRKTIGASLERWQYKGRFDQRRKLGRFGAELLQERQLDTLCSNLLERLQESLELLDLNLYLRQKDTLVAVRPRRQLPPRLLIDALGEASWNREVEPISGAELPGGAPSPEQRLFIAGYRYAFPMKVRDEPVGLLLVSYKAGELPLASDDVDLIRQVANQAALALENAQLLEQLQLRLGEVERLQEYNQDIIESSPAGIAVLREDDSVSSCNLAFAALLGRERREVQGRPVAELLAVPLPETGSGLVEERLTLEGGEQRYLQMSVAELAGSAGEAPQRILVVHDVTERVTLENELKEKDRLAALGMLAAGVAHEVNTPITGISSYAQMLLEDTPEDDPRHGLLRKVERQTFRASRIVNSLLDFSRNRKAELRILDLAQVLDETLDLLADRLDEGKARLELHAAREVAFVHGSDTELQQVFTNLVVNALDAMEPGGRLMVSLEVDEGHALVSVEDDGKGMSREEMEKIFQPFFSTKLSEGGTGLGLSISYEVVRRHGGEMRVSSTEGEGSRFEVELPLTEDIAEGGVRESVS